MLRFANTSARQDIFSIPPGSVVDELKILPSSIAYSSTVKDPQTPVYNVYVMNGKTYRGSVIQIPKGTTTTVTLQTFFLPENTQVYNCANHLNTGYILHLWSFS